MLGADPSLAARQPWKAVAEHDLAWFGALMAEHYAGDDTNVRTLAGGILAAYAGISVEDFEAQADAFIRGTQHPTLGREYVRCAYAPMVELLDYLEANGFTNYIASGGGRDFMRPISQDMYGIPRERVIGSSTTFAYTSDVNGGTITHKPEARLPRRRPGEADPDLEPHRAAPAARRRELQRRRPDARVHAPAPSTRRCASSSCTTTPTASSTTPPAPRQALQRAAADGWTVVSMKDDWTTVFSP